MSYLHHFAGSQERHSGAPFPAGKRVPFGWEAVPAGVGAEAAPLVYSWGRGSGADEDSLIRFTVALDEREEKSVQLSLYRSNCPFTHAEVRYPSALQLFEVPVDAGNVGALRSENLVLRVVRGTRPLWIIDNSPDPTVPVELRPHLLVWKDADPYEQFFARLAGLGCVQQFGWMEGCVLDGLADLAKLPKHTALKSSLQKHLDLFFKPDGQLIYENHQSEPSDNRIYGIEATLPFAALAQADPKHKSIELALAFWQSRKDAEEVIIDGTTTSSEGSYTVAYPLAVIGRQRNSDELVRLALQQVRLRHQRLVGKNVFHRTHGADGKTGDRNWARGIAWHLLGTARTLVALEGVGETKDLKKDFATFAAWVQSQQLESGLWSVFVDEPKLTPDTSGSAGIAAALAIGAKQGWLPASSRAAAAKTLEALKLNLTPDGFVSGCAQSNKGGPELQRSGYRVIFQMANGLMAQLVAALEG